MNNFSHGNGQVTSKIFGYIVTGGMQVLTPSSTAWLLRKKGMAQEFLARDDLHEYFWRTEKKILNIFLASLSPSGPSEVSTLYFSSSLLLILSLLQRNTHFYDPFPLHWGKEEVFPLHRSITTLHSILGKKKTHSSGWFQTPNVTLTNRQEIHSGDAYALVCNSQARKKKKISHPKKLFRPRKPLPMQQ